MARQRRKSTEAALQRQCVKWFRENYRNHLLVYINNNSNSLSAAVRNKNLGILRGMVDLFIFAPSGVHHGLAIELKRPGESPKPIQKEIHSKLSAQGYLVVVIKSLESFQKVVSSYLLGTPAS
jgi:hypothetical protein